MKYALLIWIALAAPIAQADYSTDRAGEKIVCSGPDNMSVTVNAKRTRAKMTVEGEGGWEKITSKDGDGDTSVTYNFGQGSVTFSDQFGDFFVWAGDDAENEDSRTEIDCK